MNSETLLLVDDEPDLLSGLKRLAKRALSCRVVTAAKGTDALILVEKYSPQVILSDIRMPDMDGMELLREIKIMQPAAGIILMTAFGTIDMAVQALQQGAYDFVTKPLNHEQLFHTIANCFERRRLLEEKNILEREVLRHRESGLLIGESPAMEQIKKTIRTVADSPISVLITGESGTGKELAARTIHRLSSRGKREMIAVNCPAIPESTLESELFGHNKGAFTGADRDHEGLFTAAHGSTLFLDEIGDLPLQLQTKLLRVLQEREIRPLGSTATRKIDFRLIASTNRNLQEKMERGEFREDLYFRLSEFSLVMPPLRTLTGDIPLLAAHFIDLYADQLKRPCRGISPAALDLLCKAPWKGNVRQLQNTIKRAVLLSQNAIIEAEDLDIEACEQVCTETSLAALTTLDYRQAKQTVLQKFCTAYFSHLLRENKGNISKTARQCGLERQSLQQLLRKFQISANDFR
jgi:DNA-binding NtrC family response regulator